MNVKILLLTLLISVSYGFPQTNLWTNSSSRIQQQGYELKTQSDAYFYFDIQQFKDKFLSLNEFEIELPISKSETAPFHLKVNALMPAELQNKFSSIRAYDAIALDRSKRTAKVEVGPNYFRVMILTPGRESLFIDPVFFTNQEQNYYVLYTASQLLKENDFECHFEGNSSILNSDFQEKAIQTCEIRTYRVAVAATGEYTTFHGGTVEQALAAQVTTINRVNANYERDLAITLTMIPNNEDIVYADVATDPYSNGQTSTMLQQNITHLNTVIGVANFDIGHVFGTDSGGLAYLNAVCKDDSKAGGVTGGSAPIGDAFDIDYVCHEMGHQFGANHSFNSSCSNNRNNSTAMEPGSGSTIMGYAGVCNPNVQSHSDAYFHAISLQEIGMAVSAFSHTCPVKTPLSNQAPEITLTTNITVPKGTPFILKGEAVDADDDELTYCWEQMDKDLSTQPPVATATKGPNFRSFTPSEEAVRYLPRANYLGVSNPRWEMLPTVGRTFKFRLTVRDNAAGGGCTDFKDVTVTADPNSGPFAITYPSATGITWLGGSTETVTWDVANTDQSPINCQNVRIRISTNQGNDYVTLIESTPNTGSATITVPSDIASNSCLILIESANQQFYTISQKMFKIKKSSLAVTDVVKEKVNISIYPNPASSSIKLSVSGIDALDGYVIYNSLGQKVKESSRTIKNNTEIDLKSIQNGVYFLQVKVGSETITRKLIKNE